MVVLEVVVVATRFWIAAAAVWFSCNATAAVLPQDRSDVMYHSYSGDGVTIDGPSVMLRKKVGNKVSFSANYYVDAISGASIDVRAQASKYQEERTETTVGADFIHNKTLMNVSYTNSSENDFEANSYHLSFSQDFFGDLSTLALSYSRGNDEIRRVGDESFLEEATRQKLGLGLSQVVSKNMIIGFNAENISDDGYLNNPYRTVRYLDADSARGFSFTTEVYPNTRVSNAFSINANYYLPYRASIYGDMRYYSDTWGVKATNAKLGYIHTIGKAWILDAHVRFYQQDKANFYQDLFNRADEFTFMARDKELSTYSSFSGGIAATYEWQFSSNALVEKSTFNIEYDYMHFDYDDFRDATTGETVGEEALFGFSANVIRAYVSIWY
ncbi:DUF3570 domain-containing protein [Alteromonas sp. 1_MG-2023]|uniref:DUF3570 domain-containing protein n=1 Tax=Alteromonas sp. 1_MG-2023 TaxID=3062669 RepID=UPI0026E38E19|nr:DUF3570 domain-containing protein [Alteromonas sp. 1_MG-2023]MDO6565564.1 DUF3570 domain-containing protein [Alteromonas sp. 1_MG-2023]